MAEQKENTCNINPHLPYLVLEKIKRYHREANAGLEPKKTVLRNWKELNNIQAFFVSKSYT